MSSHHRGQRRSAPITMADLGDHETQYTGEAAPGRSPAALRLPRMARIVPWWPLGATFAPGAAMRLPGRLLLARQHLGARERQGRTGKAVQLWSPRPAQPGTSLSPPRREGELPHEASGGLRCHRAGALAGGLPPAPGSAGAAARSPPRPLLRRPGAQRAPPPAGGPSSACPSKATTGDRVDHHRPHGPHSLGTVARADVRGGRLMFAVAPPPGKRIDISYRRVCPDTAGDGAGAAWGSRPRGIRCCSHLRSPASYQTRAGRSTSVRPGVQRPGRARG